MRVLVQNASGVMKDLTALDFTGGLDFTRSIRAQTGVDGDWWTAQVTLHRELDGWNISPLMSGTRANSSGNILLATGRLMVIEASGTFTADNLITLLYRLKPQYRANASWLMNPSSIEALRKLKLQSTGEFIWEPSSKEGQPSTLFGRPVFEDPNMPIPAADSLAVLCGDFKRAYTILDIGAPVLIRDELTTKGKVKFYVARRVGGGIIDSAAVKALELSA